MLAGLLMRRVVLPVAAAATASMAAVLSVSAAPRVQWPHLPWRKAACEEGQAKAGDGDAASAKTASALLKLLGDRLNAAAEAGFIRGAKSLAELPTLAVQDLKNLPSSGEQVGRPDSRKMRTTGRPRT